MIQRFHCDSTVLFSMIVLPFFLSCAGQSPKQQLIGEWKGNQQGNGAGSFVFMEDGNAQMTEDGVTYSGETLGGFMRWKVDPSQSPMHLDLTMANTIGEKTTLPMLLRFINHDKIEVALLSSSRQDFESIPDHRRIILERQ
jgi:hypothetical protein